MAKTAKSGDDDVIVIKKYANRRLYDTGKSRYITLDDLAGMIREGHDFVVQDAKSGEDITHSVLTQIIMEEESRGPTMLPVKFLRRIIALYGDSVQAAVPSYLDSMMDGFRENQQRMAQAMKETIATNPLADLAQRNMEMLQSAARAFKLPGMGDSDAGDDKIAAKDAEIDRLRAELQALKAAGKKK
ncbi:MAG: polyhydroxyalkanoate synthesis repressor PhaR [Sphingomonadales bacterium]|nr:polyhydroxyalkanoate synthesis repressor PhaR [Sphingomonadales bacterium]